MNERIYASLVGPFLNFYAELPEAQNLAEGRLMCATDRRLEQLWCSVYVEEKVDEMIQRWGGQKIKLYASGMEYDVDELRAMRARRKEKEDA